MGGFIIRGRQTPNKRDFAQSSLFSSTIFQATWRSSVRSAMHAASQLPGWMLPLYSHVNKKYNDDDTALVGIY